MRNRRDPEWAATVDSIGNGVGEGPLPVDGRADEHHVYVPTGARVIDGSDEVAMQTLRDLVHPHLDRGAAYTKEAARRVICAPHNTTVLEHNLACTCLAPYLRTLSQPSAAPHTTLAGLEKVPGDAVSLHGTHQLEEQAVSSEDFLCMSEEHLRTVNKSGTPPAVLQVKDSCLLMCTRNREYRVLGCCAVAYTSHAAPSRPEHRPTQWHAPDATRALALPHKSTHDPSGP